MTTTNTFKINGTSLSHMPTDHKWVNREKLGDDGQGRPIYVAPREYELKWDFLTMDEWTEIYNYWLTIGSTGTVSVDLPQYPPVSTYQFRTYSGCILNEPTAEGFFENYVGDVKLLIVRINT